MNIIIENEIMILTTGELTDKSSMLANLEALMEHPDYNQDYGLIIDLRKTDLSKIPTEEIRAYIVSVMEIAPRMPTTVANVVGGNMGFGILRMYISFSEDMIHADRNIFLDLESAIEWIREQKKPNR